MASSTVRNQVSSLARELRPYWLRDVAGSRQPAATNGGGSGGEMTVHELSGSFHTGQLANSQAPQFPLLDGSRTYTGDIEFSGSQTVDGVDISVHVADPDAHHNRVTDGGGLIVSGGNTQIVSVNQAYDFTWTGTHTFHEDIQLNANLDFLGLREITSSGSNHLTLNPGGDLILPSDKTFRSSDYADGIPITGFSLFPDPSGQRQLNIFGIKVDEMHARAFVADMVRVDIGEEWWGKSLGLLYEDFTTPSTIGGTATMVLEDAPAIAGQLFTAGDWVMLRVIDLPAVGTTGTATIAYVWGQVSAYVDLVADENGIGRQQWTFTLRDGPFSTEIKKGSVVVCFGVSGQGYIHLSALDSAQGPWIQIGDWNGTDPYTAGNRTPRTQIGRLDNLSDPDMTPTGWGLYSDNAYLRGMLRTVETMMDDDGLLFEQQVSTGAAGGQSYIAWYPDINAPAGSPIFHVNSWTQTEGGGVDYAGIFQVRQATSALGQLTISTGALFQASVNFLDTGSIRIYSENRDVKLRGDWQPDADLTYDLGTASLRWRNLYVNELFVSGSISGDTLSGAEWEYPGSMIIDANSTSATTVSITNQNTGTASLSVEGNITLGGTVDGVDIAGHDANPSAHHAPASAGDGIGVTGQVIAVNSTVVRTTRTLTAGDGLTGGGTLAADRTFDVDSTVVRTSRVITAGNGLSGGGALSANLTLTVGAGDGMNVTADTVEVDASVVRTSRILTAGDGLIGGGSLAADRTFHVNPGAGVWIDTDAVAILLHANAGLEFSGGALRMGLPADLAYDSANSVTTNTHSHNIVSTADASVIVAPTLLHATSAGGLILGTLSVAGNVDITDGGDLTVGPNLFVVNNTGDPTTSNVGINMFPDSQFALDINGPARAQYWIGPHAIQLKDVILLSHFDGKEPYNTNLTGEPNSAMGQVAITSTASGVSNLVFRPGKFFKAVEIAAAATNLVANPQFDGGSASGWVDYSTGAAGGARAVLNTRETLIGEYSYRLTKSAGADADRWGSYTTYSVTTGLTYTVSAAVYTTGMTGGAKRIRLYTDTNVNATGVVYVTPDTGTSGEWVRLNVTTTAVATGNARLYVWLDDVTTGSVHISAVQATQSSYAVPYTPSTRTASYLYYANVAVYLARLTLMAWIQPAAAASASGVIGRVFTLYKDASNFYALNYLTSDQLRLSTGAGAIVTSTGTIAGNEWTHVAVTIGGGTATLYINGVADGSAAITVPVGTLPTLYVGVTNSLSNHLGGLMDDVVLVDRALPAEEILSIYESNAPVFAESVRYSARFTTKGLGWFDDEGLWMRDTLGNPVMGFYGGEAAGKSWAGHSLNPGDILFGRSGTSQGAWLYFDRDGSGSTGMLQIGYGESSNPILSITASAAKMYGANLEMTGSAGAVLGVFATAAPAGTWGGVGALENDIVIGDRNRGGTDQGNIIWWRDSARELVIGNNTTGKANLRINANQLMMRVGTTDRILITNTGILTIRNGETPSKAVFTFDSSTGAEFTLPLTLGTDGGIYQGTGIFGGTVGPGGTIGTGLKIFNSGGIGKLSTYNAGVEQVTLDTDGKFKAGAGAVTLDRNGIAISQGLNAENRIDWYAGAINAMRLTSYNDASANFFAIDLQEVSGKMAILSLDAPGASGTDARISFTTRIGATPIASMTLGQSGLSSALNVEQRNTASSKPVLYLRQEATSGGPALMALSAAAGPGSGSGFTFNTDAVGTYRGKIKVTINGTTRYIPYYD